MAVFTKVLPLGIYISFGGKQNYTILLFIIIIIFIRDKSGEA